MCVCVCVRACACLCVCVHVSLSLSLSLSCLLKMLRLYRVDRFIQSLYFKYPKRLYIVTAFQLALYMFLFAHLMCCVWFAVGYGDPNGWIALDSALTENITGPNPDWFYPWVSSFYYAVSTMTTIGYGDISGLALCMCVCVCVCVCVCMCVGCSP